MRVSSVHIVVGEKKGRRPGPAALSLILKSDENQSADCAMHSKVLQDEISELDNQEPTKGGWKHGPVPKIKLDQEEPKSTSSQRRSGRNINTSRSKDVVENTTLSRHRTYIVPKTEAETTSSDERGRSQSVPEGRPTLSYDALVETLDNELAAAKVTCLATVTKGPKDQKPRCRNGISKPSLKDARSILESLRSISTGSNLNTKEDQLTKLANLLLCKRFHQDKAPLLVNAWEALRTPRSASPLISASAKKPAEEHVSCVATKVNTQSDEFDTSRVCIRNFVPYDARAFSRVNTEDSVKGAVMQDLTPREIKHEGLIYIYWFPGNFGHIKIGVTSLSVEKRLQEWERQCKHKTYLAFPLTEGDRQPIPHVYRVEKIVQAELRNCRKKEISCIGCRKCHNEWFECSKETAILAIQKWSAWMRKNPYEELADDVWRLKEKQRQSVKSLCQSPPPANQQRSASTSHLKQREERNRRLSVSPHSHRRSKSAEPLRRSERIAALQQGKHSTGNDACQMTNSWSLKLEPEP